MVLADSIPDNTRTELTHTPEEYAARSRTGPAASMVMHDQGLSTMMDANCDSAGRALSPEMRNNFGRLRLWDRRSKPRSTASLSRALTMLHNMKAKLAIPHSVVERAAYVYRKAVNTRLTRGRTVASLISACLYVACRESMTPRTMDDIIAISNVDKKVLYRDLRTLLRQLGISLNQYDTASFVVKMCNNLKLTEVIKRQALDILRRSEKAMITAGKHPMAMAAASTYISCILNDERITQRALSEMAGVSDVTVRNSTVLIRQALDI